MKKVTWFGKICLFALSAVYLGIQGLFISASPGDINHQGYRLITSSGHVSLWLNDEDTSFFVKNESDGAIWHSALLNPATDSVAEGINRTELCAAVSVVYYDAEGVQDTLNSYSSGVMDHCFEIKELSDGFCVTYDMDDLLSITLEITLKDGVLHVAVPTKQIRVQDGFHLESISLLPYFCSGTGKEEGYLVLPDGCGGLVPFEEDYTGIPAFERRVYGENITNEDTKLSQLNDSTGIILPFFGIRKNGSAAVCMIEEGASLATVHANGAGNISEQNHVYASFQLLDRMEYKIATNAKLIFEKEGHLCDFRESFSFLDGEEATYSGMAARLKTRFQKAGMLAEKNQPKMDACLTVWGGITVKKSVFGIRTDTVLPLTTTEQVLKIANYATEQGVTFPMIRYVNWNKQELAGKSATKISLGSGLKKGGVSIPTLQKDESFYFVPTIQTMLSYTKGNHLLSRFTTPAFHLGGVAFVRRHTSQTTMKEYGKNVFFLNARHITEHFELLNRSVKKNRYTVLGLSDYGSLLYEDFGKTRMKRFDMEQIVREEMEKMAETTSLVLDRPNYYAWRYAEKIVNLPTTGSGHLLVKHTVPFLQIVLSGVIPYASEPMNEVDVGEALLRILETGSIPHFYAYSAPESAVKNTDYTHLGSGNYKKIVDRLSNMNQTLETIYRQSGDKILLSHTVLEEHICKICYQSGLTVYVNHSDEDYSLPNGETVRAKGYFTEVIKQ